MKYTATVNAVQKPELFCGQTLEDHIPKWDAHFEGDTHSEHTTEELTFDPKDYPAGTKLVILEPECPVCEHAASYCKEVDECGSDWKQWVEEEFS